MPLGGGRGGRLGKGVPPKLSKHNSILEERTNVTK